MDAVFAHHCTLQACGHTALYTAGFWKWNYIQWWKNKVGSALLLSIVQQNAFVKTFLRSRRTIVRLPFPAGKSYRNYGVKCAPTERSVRFCNLNNKTLLIKLYYSGFSAPRVTLVTLSPRQPYGYVSS